MNTIGSFEAKTHLASLLERVAQGEQFTITRHGVPVARLIPFGPSAPVDRAAVIAELRRFRQGKRLGRLSLRKMIDEGRRF